MQFVADVHLHSHFSRATSKQLNLEHLYKWAQLKGVQVVGTGDIAHPGWLAEMKSKLEPAEEGLFRLKPEYARAMDQEVFKACRGTVRFMLAGEISNIYKKNDKVRKIHNVAFLPSFEAVEKLQASLEEIGNIRSDGRPILGLDSRDLLEIVLETDPQAYLIPAHIWTPWFALLGSMSGFDSVEECFDDLTPHIFALETGLSSDPPMNWRLSALDPYTLVSNSDAHSPQKLAREANLFNTELSYPAIFDALKTGNAETFQGTVEFFPEEGKYHFDGHRKCGIRWDPKTTLAHDGVCPDCGRNVTVGVMHRVEKLADREIGASFAARHPFTSLIPLPEVLAEIHDVGVNTKRVRESFEMLLSKLGSELHILMDVAIEDLEHLGGNLLSEGICRMRKGQVQIAAGYDGEYGTIRLFDQHDRKRYSTQLGFFEQKVREATAAKSAAKIRVAEPREATGYVKQNLGRNSAVPAFAENNGKDEKQQLHEGNGRPVLNHAQQTAVQCTDGPAIIVAGPGTGKTRTLTHRLAYLVAEKKIPSKQILAVTFTNKAAEEMSARVESLVGGMMAHEMTICTFHALGLLILTEASQKIGLPSFTIVDESDRKAILRTAAQEVSERTLKKYLAQISMAKNQLCDSPSAHFQTVDEPPDFEGVYRKYEAELRKHQLIDFDDLISQPVNLLARCPDIRRQLQERFRWISVDEYQDVNLAQYTLLKQLVGPAANLFVIGDPDQSIYGFRGSSRDYFLSFKEDFPDATVINLTKNYRSTLTILEAAADVIAKSPANDHQKAWSDIVTDKKVEIYQAATENAEAEHIVHQIEKLVGGTSYFSIDSGRVGAEDGLATHTFKDVAVLYRFSALNKPLQTALKRAGIPYQVVGETPFFQRPRVREVLSYLRFIDSPECDHHLLNILETGRKDFDNATLSKISEFGKQNSVPLWTILQSQIDRLGISVKLLVPLVRFARGLEELRSNCVGKTLPEMLDTVLKQRFGDSGSELSPGRAEEIEQLILKVRGSQMDVRSFLESVVLRRGLDDYDNKSDQVTLSTLHAAKGLEFPVVYILGCEENILPYRKENEVLDLEEERRLMYVGMTRAKQRLILTNAHNRFLFGQRLQNRPSQFVYDIEAALKHVDEQAGKRHEKAIAPKRQMSLF